MRNRTLFALALLAPLALGACGPAGKIDDFADRVCGCSSKACAEPIMKEYDAYVKANPVFKGNERQEKKMKEAMTRLLKCRAKIDNPNVTEAQLPQ